MCYFELREATVKLPLVSLSATLYQCLDEGGELEFIVCTPPTTHHAHTHKHNSPVGFCHRTHCNFCQVEAKLLYTLLEKKFAPPTVVPVSTWSCTELLLVKG